MRMMNEDRLACLACPIKTELRSDNRTVPGTGNAFSSLSLLICRHQQGIGLKQSVSQPSHQHQTSLPNLTITIVSIVVSTILERPAIRSQSLRAMKKVYTYLHQT